MTHPFGGGGHIPASQDTSKTLVDEKTALLGGIVLTIMVGVPFLGYGIASVLDIAGQLIWLGTAVYLVGMLVQYWTAQSYKDGLTVRELTMAALWPYDMFKTIRAGVKWQEGVTSTFGGGHIPASQDTSKTLVDEKTALWGGVILSVFPGLALVGYGIASVLGVVGQLIWLGVAAYVLGLFVQYWTAQSYKDGLTVNEVIKAALWPWDLLQSIRTGVKAQRLAA